MTSSSRVRNPQKKSAPNPFDSSLFDLPNLNIDEVSDDDVDENILESELEALMRGEAPMKRQKPKPKATPVLDIEKLAAECLKEEDDDENDDESDLLGDEELLKELQNLSPESTEIPSEATDTTTSNDQKINNLPSPSSDEAPKESTKNVLLSRLDLYKEAIKAAKQMNDNSKVRRYSRAVKTIESLLKSVNSGTAINEEEIPPIVSIPKPSSAPQLPDNTTTTERIESKERDLPANNSSSKIRDSNDKACTTLSSQLMNRRDKYKSAALQAKKAGNKEMALNFMKTAKCFDSVIEAAENNQPVDLSSIPPSPPLSYLAISGPGEIGALPQKREHEQTQTSSPLEIAALAAANDEDQSQIFDAPPPPSSILEALQQRLEKYLSTKQAAESEGNSSKARRLQRIVKLYETAIKDHSAGKKVDFEELPTPPGFATIPVPNTKNEASGSEKEKVVQPTKQKEPEEPSKISPTKPSTGNVNPQPAVRKPKPRVQRANTHMSSQLEFLLERQRLFREAALSSKRNGDLLLAKEYLKMSKGFDSMIEAVRCGLPIDSSSIPTPPQLESDFEIVDISDCRESSDRSAEELFENLEKDLLNQLEICRRNKEHFLRLGDVSSVTKFEKLGVESKKDLSVILHLKKTGQPPPKFHYETRLFSMVICNPEIADNELEVKIERGINLPGKSDDLDSYVRVEFPIPNENPQRAKTQTIRDTNNPIYDASFKFEINRKSRSQLRLFKRHSIKLEVWSKGGFLRSDSLLGTAMVKLLDLESKCTVHDSFSLKEGRKNLDGKLEVIVRIRDPLLAKQVEQVQEKWLVIGN